MLRGKKSEKFLQPELSEIEPVFETEPVSEIEPGSEGKATDSPSDDSWDDAIFEDVPIQADSFDPPAPAKAAKAATGKQKPSLLAAPLIIVGWVKDLVASFTQPKPSKPVIDIPRREPSIQIDRQSAPPQDPPEDSFEDPLEESNWDD